MTFDAIFTIFGQADVLVLDVLPRHGFDCTRNLVKQLTGECALEELTTVDSRRYKVLLFCSLREIMQ